jgi:hypothetical protein
MKGSEMLSDEDLEGLRRTAADVSDMDSATIQRVEAGFRFAYERAARVVSGELDPLSA